MTPSDQLSFERQVVAFLGNMAEELPGGRLTPPPAMLRRARTHIALNATWAAVIAVAILVGLMVAGRALLGGHGVQPVPPLIGGAGAIGGEHGRAGASRAGGDIGRGGFGAVSVLFDPPGGTWRGPDGGAWGSLGSRAGGGRTQAGQSGSGSGAGQPGQKGGSSGGPGWRPPPSGGVAGGGWGGVIPPWESGSTIGQAPGWIAAHDSAQTAHDAAEGTTHDGRTLGR